MRFKPILKMALVTMATMFVANQVAGMNATARKLLKGSSVSAVGNGGSSGVVSVKAAL